MIKFYSGPLDGMLVEERSELLPFIVVDYNCEAVIYKNRCCNSCTKRRSSVPYSFVGYDTESADEQHFTLDASTLVRVDLERITTRN